MEDNMNEMVEELKQLFTELIMILEKYGNSSCNIVKRHLKGMLFDLEENGSDIDTLSQVKRDYNSLFFQEAR